MDPEEQKQFVARLRESSQVAFTDDEGEAMREPTLEDFGIDGRAALVETGRQTMGKLIAAEKEIERLRDLASALMAHMDQMPVKHPQQGERRNELRRQFDELAGHQQGAPGK